MSQSHNQTDSQALLQSMLQKLKLQSGREGQSFLHTHVPVTADSSLKEGGENGPGFGSTGNLPKEFGISSTDSDIVLKGGDTQQPGHDTGLASFPSHKNNIDSDMGENSVLGQVRSHEITPTATRQLFPAASFKDVDTTSCERTGGERVGFGSSSTQRQIDGNNDAVTRLGQNQAQEHGLKPKTYLWSLRHRGANLDTDSQENKVLHVGNGRFETPAQSKDVQFVTNSQKTTNSSSRRKQRSSEHKTRRWTQKIKERWLERSASFGKKGKGGEQGTELPAAENLNASNKEEERTLFPSDSSDPSQPPPAHTVDSALQGHVRSSGDFEFGLGSFSLLDEIMIGQEWGKFLNPNLTANQRPEIHENNLWSFRSTESSPVSDFSLARTSPDAFLPANMDVPLGQQQCLYRAANLSEPMEDFHSLEKGQEKQCKSLSLAEPTDNVDNAMLRRGHFNRKRQHQSAERRLQTEKISDVKEASKGASISSLSMTSHVMDETGESQQDSMSLCTRNSLTPLPPTSFNPFAPAPRGVLKPSISQDSEASMETVIKRRRVEENRRVHFSEEVVAIAAPVLDVDSTDSEEDSGTEEDSVIEEDCEVEQAMVEDVAPARRPTLPAWIQALKRKNTGRKHR